MMVASDYDWPAEFTAEDVARAMAMAKVVDRYGGQTCDVRAVVLALRAAGYATFHESASSSSAGP
jgi:hypothetical protein